jgi:hypothetical protein
VQLTTVGKEVWRTARQAERLDQAGAEDPVVSERLRKLRLVEALRNRGAGWSEVQSLVGISRATYYRYKQRLREEGLGGLKPKSRRPRRLRRKVYWTPDLLVKVETLRKQNPTRGRWLIWLALKKGGGSIGSYVSERTIGRILRYLERQGRVESAASFLARSRRGGTGKARRRARRPYARRKPRSYDASQPGDLVQVDTLTVTLGPGEVVKHFSAVDLYTRFSLAEVHTRATANLAASFLAHLIASTPFPVKAIQVDGGSEFMAERKLALRAERRSLLPIRRKALRPTAQEP